MNNKWLRILFEFEPLGIFLFKLSGDECIMRYIPFICI